VQFWLILPKFGCHGNSLGSLESLDSVFEFADRESFTIHAKVLNFLRSRTEVNAILAFFAQIWLPW